jgi:hypothetical protein
MNGNPVVTTNNSAAGNYLNAIVSARTGNTDECIEFLSIAIEMNADYKNEAKKDFEFIKLKDNTSFQGLIN